MSDSIRQGEVLFASGKLEAAEALFQSLIKKDPLRAEVYNNLGVIAFHTKRMDTAIAYFNRSLGLDPYNKETVINYGCVLKHLNLLYKGKPVFDRISKKYPEDETLRQFSKQADSAYPFSKKVAVLCLPGLESFLGNIVDYLKTSFHVLPVYSSSDTEIEEAIHWADTVWLEWANDLTIDLTNHPTLLNRKRTICRLHSYEAFDGLTSKIRWDRISDLIFVASHIRDFALSQFPDIRNRVKNIYLIPNGVDMDKFTLCDKPRGRNLAYLGLINYKKGPMLLLHAFRELIQTDSRYRLFIAGKFQDVRYKLYFEQMTEEMGLAPHIQFDGWIEDPAEWLKDKHYIVCTSVLEGNPIGIMEAMATGMKPIIHHYVGAKDTYPENYIWNTIPEFIEKVTEKEYNPRIYRKFIEENYSLDRQLDRIQHIITSTGKD